MMKRRSAFRRISESDAVQTIVSAAFGVAVILLCLVGFSFLMTVLDSGSAIKSAMSGVALCSGAFAAGCRCARQKRRGGLANGLVCGAIVYFAVFFIGTFVLGLASGAGFFTKLLLACVTSAVGGICGVNSQRSFKAAKAKKTH